MRRTHLVVALALGVGLAAPVAAQFRPRIVNGVLTSGHPTVGALLDGNNFETASLICSGTLIGCQTFLTAGHCVEGFPNPADYSVFFQHAGFFAVASVELHPSYDFPNADVAVLRLATPVTGIVPSPINTVASPAFGSSGDIVGFGRTGGVNSDYGIKRAGSIVTASCTSGLSNTASVCWNFLNPLGPPGEDSSTCNGDSGGPLFVDLGGGDVVAGVTSGGNSASCLPDDLSFDTNVFTYRTFIQAEAGGDLGGTSCGAMPQVGGSDTTLLPFGGQVSAGSPEGRHSFAVGPGLNRIRIAMNALDDGFADFDLYVKLGSPPTTSSFDCARTGPNQYAFCEFPAPAAGTWHVLVRRFSGTGDYQATATIFGVDCASPGNAGRSCDDQNQCTSTDVCQGGTCAGTPLGDGAPCDDGNQCTGPDLCQAGACNSPALSDGAPCNDGHVCTIDDHCQAGACTATSGPAPSCKRPFLSGKGILHLKDDLDNDNRDRIVWRWASGAQTDKAEWGNPVTGAAYGLCLYDERGSGPILALERTLPTGPPWFETNTGFKYNDRTLAAAGLRSVTLRAGAEGRASIALKAQGPAVGSLMLPLGQQPRVRMQLVSGSSCWEAVYSTRIFNDSEQFKARAD